MISKDSKKLKYLKLKSLYNELFNLKKSFPPIYSELIARQRETKKYNLFDNIDNEIENICDNKIFKFIDEKEKNNLLRMLIDKMKKNKNIKKENFIKNNEISKLQEIINKIIFEKKDLKNIIYENNSELNCKKKSFWSFDEEEKLNKSIEIFDKWYKNEESENEYKIRKYKFISDIVGTKTPKQVRDKIFGCRKKK